MLEGVLLKFDGQLYSPEVIQKAAYRSMTYLTADITLSHKGLILCAIVPNKSITEEQFSFGVEEFKKHVIDYQLRHNLKKETEPLRNLVLGVAFSNTGLLQGE